MVWCSRVRAWPPPTPVPRVLAVQFPGVLSGNVIQVPVHVPVNVCGNTVSVIGLLNPAFGNTCINN